ncbi:MAG: hypothetical protein P1V34_15710 [Alphaproteobacteria bacterium]|nr:hypothetical protein [Alphaproteobacteria bacterium]
MADTPISTAVDMSNHFIVSENETNAPISMNMLKDALHIDPNNSSIDPLGQLTLPIDPQSISAIQLQGSDLIIINLDGSIVILDDFTGALEAGLLTNLMLSDGTTMDVIDFLDTFSPDGIINEMLFSIETAGSESSNLDLYEKPLNFANASTLTKDHSSTDESVIGEIRLDDTMQHGVDDITNWPFSSPAQAIDQKHQELLENSGNSPLQTSALLDIYSPDCLDNYLPMQTNASQQTIPLLTENDPSNRLKFDVAIHLSEPDSMDLLRIADEDHGIY